MSHENNEAKKGKCKCSKFRIFNGIVLTAVLVSSVTSAYYSYSVDKTLKAIIKGIQPSAAQAAPVAASNDSITKKYAKNRTLEKAQKTEKPIIAFFYADWCGYCKRFAPTFDKITKNGDIKSNLAVAYINCEAPENAHLIGEYQIQGFPTVYLINPKTGIKEQVNNSELFTATAEKDLTQRFVSFAKK